MTARDTIAELIGLVYVPAVRCWYTDPAAEDQHFICADPKHPIPNTIDFIAAVWPEGVVWQRGWHEMWAYVSQPVITVPITGDFLLDFLTLYAKVLQWLRDNDRPAFDAAVEKARRVMEEAR